MVNLHGDSVSNGNVPEWLFISKELRHFHYTLQLNALSKL